ncbi:MAG: GEVED domain-containing protein, partial [Pirellulales bacterium]|nr:GEVED domain-containing protein [Pirellulales bacterium]
DDLATSGTTVDFSVVEPSVGVHVSSSEVHNGDLFGIDPKNAHLYNDNSIEYSGPALNDVYSDGNTKREVFAFDGFTSAMRMEANGLTVGNSYRMTISIADVENAQLDSAIFIEANSVGSVITFGEDRDSVIGGIHWEGYGDPNLERLQGQIIIDSNTFTSNEEFGLNVQAGTRTDARVPLAGDLPHPGAARNLGAGNPEQLAPGVVVTNNIFANNEAGQLRISGEDTTGVTSTGIVPFARVVNNTIVGGTDGSARPGIVVENNASPTILNNIIAFTTTGISVDGTSDTTIVGGNAYADNTADVNGIVQGDFAINVNSGDPLFTNLSAGNFYPAGSSRVVDASLNSLQDRLSLETLRESVGIAPSPIIASDVDRFGQLRVDDPQVAPPVGLGFNVVKDRGAVERADYTGPSAYLIMPHDNDRNGVDLNQDENNVKLNDIPLSEFRIQLVDNVVPITTQFGSMIDDSTVAANAVEVYQYEGLNQVIVEACCGDLTQFNNRKLELGRDYSFNYDATNDVISIKSLAGSFEQNNYYRITIRSGDGTVLEIPAGIDLPDGTTFDITDEDSQTATFEYDSGYVLQMPQASTLVLPDSDDLDSLDRTTFEIAGALSSVIFEFDTDGTVFDTNQAITYGVNATATEIANTAATVMNAADLGLHAKVVALDDDQIGIHVGANRDHAVTLGNSSPLTEVGIAGAIDHHDSLIVDDGTEAIEFYFDFTTAADRDTDFVPADTVTEAVSILVRHDMTHVELAQALSIAISNKDLGLSPTSNADGLTHVGGEFNHRIDLANAPNITVDGAPGLLNTPLSIRVLGHGDVVLAEDGETFQVANSVLGSTVLFEFDDDGSINDSTAVAVNFTDTSSVSDLVTEIVTEINNANLELEAFESSNSVVGFVDSSAAAVTVGTAVGAIDVFGTAGLDPAVAISYSPFENNEQIAEATADAINSVSGTILDGVMATRDVDSVTINGAQSIVSSDMDILNVVSRTGVKDHAGNALLPNSEIDKAEFIIETGVELDYGDAPHSYATNKESGGPTHVVVEGFSLGENVTVEANANVDDGDDGVVFSEVLESGFTSEITVTLNNSAQLQNAVLDAWIDFDRDEVFGEHERVLTAKPLDAGEQDIDISVPAGTLPGRTYARLRLSTTGGLLPTGPAFSGEVEDYQITIGGNPWMNPFEPLDVNRDGHITPIDSLLVINKLNDLASGDDGRLPVPVPEDFKPEDVGYLDVNDNGYVDPLDALRVINKLNEIFAESEDAAEGEFSNLEDVIAAISYDVEEARDNDESDHDDFFSGL